VLHLVLGPLLPIPQRPLAPDRQHHRDIHLNKVAIACQVTLRTPSDDQFALAAEERRSGPLCQMGLGVFQAQGLAAPGHLGPALFGQAVELVRQLGLFDALGHGLQDERMGIGADKVMMNIERYGNTTAGTIPLLLWDYEKQLKKGDNIILSAFGGGFTWGAIYLKWAYDGSKSGK